MRTSVMAGIAAGAAAVMAAQGLAVGLGILTNPLVQMREEQGLPAPSWVGPFALVGAVLWALIACAFLARVGLGPLSAAPRWLVAVLGWYAVLAAAFGAVSDGPSMAQIGYPALWFVGVVIADLVIVGFGGLTMWRTARRDQPTSTEPPMARPTR